MEITPEQKLLADTQRREYDDLQNEIAGREIGRRTRFLRDGPNSEDAKRKEREAQRVLDRLVELLNDPIYRAKYGGVLQLLSDAEQATEAAIDQLTLQIQDTEAAFAEMMDKAARLPDGTLVFRDVNGIVRREDGARVEDHLADTILWTGQEPSFDNFHAARERIDGLQRQLDAANGYQNDVLGPVRDKMTDPDDPPPLEELDDIANDISSAMPDIVRDQMPKTDAATPDEQTQSIGLPKLGG